jgi:hypothetical protein
MVSQLRIDTIHRGMPDAWVTLFHEQLKPHHEKYGIPIEATWVKADRTEFLWIRSVERLEDMPKQEAAYYSSPERKALGDRPQTHLANMEVRLIERAAP